MELLLTGRDLGNSLATAGLFFIIPEKTVNKLQFRGIEFGIPAFLVAWFPNSPASVKLHLDEKDGCHNDMDLPKYRQGKD